MKNALAKYLALPLTLSCLAGVTALALDEDSGGERNISLRHLNDYPGYDSDGDVVYNKMQIPGETIHMEQTYLYNSSGQEMVKAWESDVGYVNGSKDGGINAGCITTLKIDGVKTECVYMFSVNAKGGRASGWTPISVLSPQSAIREAQYEIEANIEDARPRDKWWKIKRNPYTVIDKQLPSEAEEWYLMPNRTGSAGKAKYYYTQDGHLYGLTNIPETGNQRYGVVFDISPVGDTFYVDSSVEAVSLPIYARKSSTPSAYSMTLVYGFFWNNAGDKRFCWTNLDCLEKR